MLSKQFLKRNKNKVSYKNEQKYAQWNPKSTTLFNDTFDTDKYDKKKPIWAIVWGKL